WCADPPGQRLAELERIRRSPTSDNEAAKPARMRTSGEQQRARADIRSDRVGLIELKCVSEADHELAHCTRREQLIAALRMPEPRQVHCHQVHAFSQTFPRRRERQQALRPGAQQQRMYVARLTLGE